MLEYFNFNDGRSAIVLRWSPINQAWIVTREDSGHQALIRIHNEKDDAMTDYKERIAFVELMQKEG